MKVGDRVSIDGYPEHQGTLLCLVDRFGYLGSRLWEVHWDSGGGASKLFSENYLIPAPGMLPNPLFSLEEITEWR